MDTKPICPACDERGIGPDDPGHAQGCPYPEMSTLRARLSAAVAALRMFVEEIQNSAAPFNPEWALCQPECETITIPPGLLAEHYDRMIAALAAAEGREVTL